MQLHACRSTDTPVKRSEIKQKKIESRTKQKRKTKQTTDIQTNQQKKKQFNETNLISKRWAKAVKLFAYSGVRAASKWWLSLLQQSPGIDLLYIWTKKKETAELLLLSSDVSGVRTPQIVWGDEQTAHGRKNLKTLIQSPDAGCFIIALPSEQHVRPAAAAPAAAAAAAAARFAAAARVHSSPSVCIHIYIYIYIHISLCIYIYACVHIYIYIYFLHWSLSIYYFFCICLFIYCLFCSVGGYTGDSFFFCRRKKKTYLFLHSTNPSSYAHAAAAAAAAAGAAAAAAAAEAAAEAAIEAAATAAAAEAAPTAPPPAAAPARATAAAAAANRGLVCVQLIRT